MFLRAALEKTLPVREGERRLTPSERKYVLRGMYFLRGNVIDVETRTNRDHRRQNAFPYAHTVTRQTSFGYATRSGEDYGYKSEGYDIAESARQPEALKRVNRVQKIARYVKASVGVAAVAGGFTAAIVEGASADGQYSQVVSCAEDTQLQGSETLAPLSGTVAHAQEVGQAVCMIGVHPYEFTPQ
ncbi:MAG TPA: hypothetical protein VIM53_00400 [Candidatus Saccharimonadales bacterium]